MTSVYEMCYINKLSLPELCNHRIVKSGVTVIQCIYTCLTGPCEVSVFSKVINNGQYNHSL